MHFSGILVSAHPQELTGTSRRVDALPGVEVHYLDPEGGRIVVVLETETLEEQQEGLRHIEKIPGVLAAALVEHRFEELVPNGLKSE
ncbi:MAG: chaperone NapD [Thermoanaerobaculia bacterium]|jgi:nitrate reductase NapAB chaperone NapD